MIEGHLKTELYETGGKFLWGLTMVRMNIAVDVMLFLKDGIVPCDEEQESETNQPD